MKGYSSYYFLLLEVMVNQKKINKKEQLPITIRYYIFAKILTNRYLVPPFNQDNKRQVRFTPYYSSNTK